MGVLSIVGFALSLVLLPPRVEERVVTRGRPPVGWSVIVTDRIIAGLFFFRLAYTAGIGIIWGFLPVFADTQFSISASSIGILVMLGVFVSGVVHVPMGWLADRLNRKFMVTAGGLMTTGAVYAFCHAGGFMDLFWSSVVFGLGGGIAMPALMATAVWRGNRKEAMGSVMALLTVAHSLGMLIGSLSAGIMMDWFALRQAFVLGAVIMAVGTLLFVGCTWRTDLRHTAAPAAVPQIPEG
jgi:MFS family permease